MKNKKLNLGIVLIVIGIVWILSNLNLININLYGIFNHIARGMFDLWPLVLVIIGINIMFKKDGLNTILWILFLIILIVYSLFIKDNILKKEVYSPEIVEEIDMRQDIDRGSLNLDVGATNFTVNSIDDELISLDHDGAFTYKFESKGSTERIYIANKKDVFKNNNKRSFQLGLNKNIPWDLAMNVGAVSGEIDLKDIKVENMDLDIGAGSVEITLGDKSELTNIDIDAGVSEVILNIPKDSGLKIEIDGALNSTNLNDIGLIKTDKENYVSGNFNSSSSKYEIEVDMGVGQFTVNHY